MVPIGAENTAKSSDATLDPAFADGNVMGKRYVDDSGAEVLVPRPVPAHFASGRLR
jgi:hypothetical protein